MSEHTPLLNKEDFEQIAVEVNDDLKNLGNVNDIQQETFDQQRLEELKKLIDNFSADDFHFCSFQGGR